MARPQEINKIQIVDKAIELIEVEGVESLSMRSLAIKCGVATSTLYLHFANKLEIVIAVAEKFWEECFRELDLSEIKDFFVAIKVLYMHTLSNLEKFNVSLLGLFSAMKGVDKEKGKKAMGTYLNLIRSQIISQLKIHEAQFDADFYSQMGGEFLADYIYEVLVGMLMRFNHKYDNFESVLKRILIR